MEQQLQLIIHIRLISSKEVITVVLPSDFFNIEESSEALVSFDLPVDSNSNKISITSEVKVGRADLIEVYT
jgi:hypothetical protein